MTFRPTPLVALQTHRILYFPLLAVILPANASLFFNELMKMAAFDVIYQVTGCSKEDDEEVSYESDQVSEIFNNYGQEDKIE